MILYRLTTFRENHSPLFLRGNPMKKRTFITIFYFPFVITFFLFISNIGSAQEDIRLPSPRIRGQLMKSLKNRISIKGFDTKQLPDQLLSDMLWTAFGIANERTGRRTAPSAFNAQEIDIYVLRADGAWLYDAHSQSLRLINRKDIRNLVAGQEYARSAPVQLAFVADYDRAHAAYPGSYEEEAVSWAMLHTGFIVQNVTIFCAARRLCAVVRTVGNSESLREALSLRKNQAILISQAVGYPPE